MCSCSNFFYCCSVSPLWPLAFLIFSQPIRYENFHPFLPTKYVSFAFYLSIYLFPCYPSLTWFSRKKKTRLDVQLPIHPHMDDVYNWQVIIIFHVHKFLPCLSIVSSKYDFEIYCLTCTVVGGGGTYGQSRDYHNFSHL